MEATVFIAILVALVIGFVLGRFKTHAFQNRSEATLSRALKMRFVPPDYHLLNHVTLRLEDGTTQIDHVIARQSGWQRRVNQDGKGSRGFWIMLQLIVAGKLSFPFLDLFLDFNQAQSAALRRQKLRRICLVLRSCGDLR